MDVILTKTNGNNNVGCEESRNSNKIEPCLQGCMKSVVSCVQRKTNVSEGEYSMWSICQISYTQWIHNYELSLSKSWRKCFGQLRVEI